MKNVTKIVCACLSAVLLIAALAACGLSEEGVVGTWSGSYTYNGNDFSVIMELESDGSYSKVITMNGELSKNEVGDYEVDGGKLILYPADSAVYHGTRTVYQFKNGALVNNDHYFYKK